MVTVGRPRSAKGNEDESEMKSVRDKERIIRVIIFPNHTFEFVLYNKFCSRTTVVVLGFVTNKQLKRILVK